MLDIEKHNYKTLAPSYLTDKKDEDIVHASPKVEEIHEQGTASGSWSWNNSI